MRPSMLKLGGTAVVVLSLLLSACISTDERALRHLVSADIIQREHVLESHIEISSIRVSSPQHAVVIAKVLGQGGRRDSWRKVRYQFERDAGRWVVRRVEPI